MDRLKAASAESKSSGLMSFLQSKPETLPKENPSGETTVTGEGAALKKESAEAVPLAGEATSGAVSKKIECQGLGWELTDDPAWVDYYRAYLTYVEGGEKASSKGRIEKRGGTYLAIVSFVSKHSLQLHSLQYDDIMVNKMSTLQI